MAPLPGSTGPRPRSLRFSLYLLVFALGVPACSLIAGDLTLPAGPADGLGGDSGGDSNATGGLSSSSGGSTNASGGLDSGGEASGGQATGGGEATGGGGPLPPALDGPCPKSGLTECDADNPTQKLVCSKGSWQSNGNCDPGRNCDPASGQCRDIVPECDGLEAGDTYCGPNDTVWACGENLVSSAPVEECAGKCVAASASATCVPATCGDGKPQPGEDCDDGNTNNSDDCTELCRAPFCGDGFKNSPAEECDDGDSDNADGCTELCREPYCGDTFTNGGEECDDGNHTDTDDCSNSCRENRCSAEDGTPICPWRVAEVSTGANHSCARRVDGQVLCWGYNASGQLGRGDTVTIGAQEGQLGANLRAVALKSGRQVTAISSGDYFNCAILDDYSIQCWGDNEHGELGIGDSKPRGDESGELGDNLPTVALADKAIRLALGAFHACAVVGGGTVQCWGNNQYGQLGAGTSVAIGLTSTEIPKIDLGSGETAGLLVAGDAHTCALLESNQVKCWGYNYQGELGIGTNKPIGDESGEMGDSLASVPLPANEKIVNIAAGGHHTCALLDRGSVICWGSNDYGQLGLGDNKPRGDEPGELGEMAQPAALPYGEKPVSLALGFAHTCVHFESGRLVCFGANDAGQLGQEQPYTRGDDPFEMGDYLPLTQLGYKRTTRSLRSRRYHTCAVLDGGTVKCWGENSFGQLGLGDARNRGAFAGDMADALPEVSLW